MTERSKMTEEMTVVKVNGEALLISAAQGKRISAEKLEAELERLRRMTVFETEAQAAGYRAVAGIDEAGRGPLAGPVVSAAVILRPGCFLFGLNDSKKLSEPARERLYQMITENAVAYGIGIVDHETIDRINILNATKQSMYVAVERLGKTNVPDTPGMSGAIPDFLLIDAVRLDSVQLPQKPIIHGDALSLSIAAASIVAKFTRDRMMYEYDREYPAYGFAKHKGYGTRQHMDAIRQYGPTPIHRRTYLKNLNSEGGCGQ